MNEIVETLKSADNESTAAPYWLIIDPETLGLSWYDDEDETKGKMFAELDEYNVESIGERIPHCITGPFFSRTDADAHLKGRRYAFSDKEFVYCNSGHWSQKYKDLCRTIGKT
jgi:hypothetical protein